MRSTVRSIILAGLALTATAAAAAPPREDWVTVGRFVDGGPVQVDKASLYTRQGLTQVPWRIAFAKPRQDGSIYEEHVMLVDCAQGVSAGISTTHFDADGKVVRYRPDSERQAEERLGRPTPGSTGEKVAIAACDMLAGARR